MAGSGEEGGKFRRVALPGAGPAAARDHDVAVERAMFADVMRGARAPAGPTVGAALAAGASGGGGGGGGDTLTMTLLKRLAETEETLGTLRASVAAKDREIASLTRQLRDARAASAAPGGEVEALRAQVSDMEAFLRDYGLVWVGGPPPSTDDAAPPAAPSAATAAAAAASVPGAPATAAAAAAPPVDLDFPVLLLRLNQLNALVGAGIAKVVKKDGVHKFEVQHGTPLTVYRNGFMLNRGPFRPYTDATARAFIQVCTTG